MKGFLIRLAEKGSPDIGAAQVWLVEKKNACDGGFPSRRIRYPTNFSNLQQVFLYADLLN